MDIWKSTNRVAPQNLSRFSTEESKTNPPQTTHTNYNTLYPQKPSDSNQQSFGSAPFYSQSSYTSQYPSFQTPQYGDSHPPPLYIAFPFPPPPKQQQQSQVVVVGGQQAPVVVQRELLQSFLAPIILSCFTFWFCGCLFGLIAFILAVVGQNSVFQGDVKSARLRLKSSYGVSIAGIIIGVIVIVVLAAVFGTRAASAAKPQHCSTPQCLNGMYSDPDTCMQCCPNCSNGLSFTTDSKGCKQCCGACSYGFASTMGTDGCRQCCMAVVCSYGSYSDPDGCKQCCSSVTCTAGSYTGSTGCKQCCTINSYCWLGSYIDSNQCKQCY